MPGILLWATWAVRRFLSAVLCCAHTSDRYFLLI
jgi:hypothetical protein